MGIQKMIMEGTHCCVCGRFVSEEPQDLPQQCDNCAGQGGPDDRDDDWDGDMPDADF